MWCGSCCLSSTIIPGDSGFATSPPVHQSNKSRPKTIGAETTSFRLNRPEELLLEEPGKELLDQVLGVLRGATLPTHEDGQRIPIGSTERLESCGCFRRSGCLRCADYRPVCGQENASTAAALIGFMTDANRRACQRPIHVCQLAVDNSSAPNLDSCAAPPVTHQIITLSRNNASSIICESHHLPGPRIPRHAHENPCFILTLSGGGPSASGAPEQR